LRWLQVDETAITFGIKRVLWQSIDEVNLTMFGNLVLKSRSICGPPFIEKGKDKNPADIILKVPFSALTLASQKEFVELLREKRPSTPINARLVKQVAQPLLKGIALVQGFTVVFLTLALLDFGYSEFRYLENLKEYFLAHKEAVSGSTSDAQQHMMRGEDIRLHPLPISWISNKVMATGTIAAGLSQARSQALWALGRKEEAVTAAIEAADQAAKAFSYRLRLARLYAAMNEASAATDEIGKVESDHKDALLPRLYRLAILVADNQTAKAKTAYTDYMKTLDSEVFTEPVVWPPGGEPFVHELFHKDDLEFVFGRMFDRKSN
jgi:hypothetical protein